MSRLYSPFPFAVVGEVRRAYRVTAPTVPPFIDLDFVDVGPPINYSGYGRFCYCFTRQGFTSYTPWVLVNIVPLLVPMPDVRNAVTVELLLDSFPGYVIEATEIRL